MSFFLTDDLKGDLSIAKKSPSKQYVGDWCDAWEVDRVSGDCDYCPVCGRPVSMLKWLKPRKMRLTNTKYPDRLTAWLSEPLVISERCISVFEEAEISGIKRFDPIEVVKVAHMTKNSSKPPSYFCAEIDYAMCVRVDPDKSTIIGQKTDWCCELCNPWGSTVDHIEKLVLDTVHWDGTDIFRVYSLGVVVSQRFLDVVLKNNMTNFNLVSVDDYQR